VPILMIYQCAHCQKESARLPSGTPSPDGWVSVMVGGNSPTTEWFDAWACVVAYSQTKETPSAGA
jgi:hypothetical protein